MAYNEQYRPIDGSQEIQRLSNDAIDELPDSWRGKQHIIPSHENEILNVKSAKKVYFYTDGELLPLTPAEIITRSSITPTLEPIQIKTQQMDEKVA